MRIFILLILAAACAALASGCATRAMRSTPFYTGKVVLGKTASGSLTRIGAADATSVVEISADELPSAQRAGLDPSRVNAWPVAYYSFPNFSVLWPLFERTDRGWAFVPFIDADDYDKSYRILLFGWDSAWRRHYFIPLYFSTPDTLATPLFVSNAGTTVIPPLLSAYSESGDGWSLGMLGGLAYVDAKNDGKGGRNWSHWFIPLYFSTPDTLATPLFIKKAGDIFIPPLLSGYSEHGSKKELNILAALGGWNSTDLGDGKRNWESWFFPAYYADGNQDGAETVCGPAFIGGWTKWNNGKEDAYWFFPLFLARSDGLLASPVYYQQEGVRAVLPPIYAGGDNKDGGAWHRFIWPLGGIDTNKEGAVERSWAFPLYFLDKDTAAVLPPLYFRDRKDNKNWMVPLAVFNDDMKEFHSLLVGWSDDGHFYGLTPIFGRYIGRDGSATWRLPWPLLKVMTADTSKTADAAPWGFECKLAAWLENMPEGNGKTITDKHCLALFGPYKEKYSSEGYERTVEIDRILGYRDCREKIRRTPHPVTADNLKRRSWLWPQQISMDETTRSWLLFWAENEKSDTKLEIVPKQKSLTSPTSPTNPASAESDTPRFVELVTRSGWSFLFPAYYSDWEDTQAKKESSWTVFPFIWGESNTDATDTARPLEKSSWTLLPFYWSESKRENDKELSHWETAFLWLYTFSSETKPTASRETCVFESLLWCLPYLHESVKSDTLDTATTRVFWKLYHYERRGAAEGVDVFPFISWSKNGGWSKFSILWRAFNYETDTGKSRLDILFLPVWN